MQTKIFQWYKMVFLEAILGIITEELAEKGKISITLKDISKRVGQLFMVRMEVNLQCNVTTTPEFFWEEDRNVREYILISKYMEIGNVDRCIYHPNAS